MTKVLEYLKPKVKALGFKKEILEGIAADIADNLEEVDDEASDEDVNAKIKPAVDAVIPSLKLAQRLTNQGIEEFRKKQEKANEQKPEQKPEEKPEQKPEEKPSSDPPQKKDPEEQPAWLKQFIEASNAQMKKQTELIESLQSEITGMKTKSTTEKRRALLEDLLKDTGTFGKRTLKSFEKMSFETDADFDEFVSDVKEDLEQLNQERADEGLAKFGAPQVEPKKEEPAKPKTLTDAELEELAANL